MNSNMTKCVSPSKPIVLILVVELLRSRAKQFPWLRDICCATIIIGFDKAV